MISIIVPVYNTAPYLEKCLSSLVSQTYKDIEIILIDDCSTDNSAEIIRSWEEKDNRIRAIYKEKNSGVSDSRNRGLSIARGEYLGFVDSDDWIDKNMYSVLLSALEKSDADIAVCSTRKVFSNFVKKLAVQETEGYVGRNYATSACMTYIGKGYNNMFLWNKLFRKNIFKGSIPQFRKDIHYCEDILWVTEAFCKADKFVFCPQILYNYRCDREGNSINLLHNGTTDPIKAYSRIYTMLKENNIEAAKAAYQRMLSYKAILIKHASDMENYSKFKLGSKNFSKQLCNWAWKEKNLYAFKWALRREAALIYHNIRFILRKAKN